jgi:hypothetical protein
MPRPDDEEPAWKSREYVTSFRFGSSTQALCTARARATADATQSAVQLGTKANEFPLARVLTSS